MAENESNDCPCSNITIMQLFHELKQNYPSVPDQIVSKVIQENCHDKSACQTILRKESHKYLQSYPGAIISGNPRETVERGSLCNHCPASRASQQYVSDVTHPPQCAMPNNRTSPPQKRENAFSSSSEDSSIYSRETSETEQSVVPKNSKQDRRPRPTCLGKPFRKVGDSDLNVKQSLSLEERVKKSSSQSLINCDTKAENGAEISAKESKGSSESAWESSVSTPETKGSTNGYASSLNSSRTFCSECDSAKKSVSPERSHSDDASPNLREGSHSEVETVRWTVENGSLNAGSTSGLLSQPVSTGQMSVHNYQVAVQYSMQPALPLRPGSQQRSFTTVNLSLRPPSSEPQPPIEIQSGQNLTYTTSVYDAKKGVQSQLQIKITPALLKKQLERKDLLARELRKEREKLRNMQNEVRLMKASIAQKPNPQILPKLKAEIERLRAECERLTQAVDLYSDTQNSLPLGETDEEFYRNIYTGQRLQREGNWSCQLCTFRNHPLLSVCEECEMPRISLGTQVMDVATQLSNVLSNNNTSFCTGGGTSTSASLITAPLQER